MYHIRYTTNENTFPIILHNSGGYFGLILSRIKFSANTRSKHSRNRRFIYCCRKSSKKPYKLLCLTKNTRLDQEESNGQIFWTLLKSVKGKIIVNTDWELAYAIKQTRRDRMANTASHLTFYSYFMHDPFAFCYDCQPPLGEIVF